MTISLPAAVNLHTLNHSVDARARGITNGAVQGLKPGGNLPLTTSAAVVVNNTASSQTGTWTALHWEFLATGGYDVSSETRVAIFGIQFATADRIQISDLVNDGIAIRIGSGIGSPPSNYKHYQVGGRDRPLASSMVQSLPVVIDLNDTSNESTGGTFDNTDVQTYGPGNVRWDMFGTLNGLMVISRAFVFTTAVDSADIPLFTGAGSDWDDLVDFVQGADFTDKIGEWCFRNGSTVVVPIPWQIGDGTTATTFNDNGDTIVGPPHDDVNDPRFRLTSQALRGYIRLRDNAADIVTLSGTYNFIDSNKPDLDFDVSNAAVITLTGSTWIGRGPITLGSSVAGAATWDRCGTVDATAGPDVDGSIFKSPTNDALLIDSTQTLADLRFESYTGQVALNVGAGASNVNITLDNCFFDKTGTFEVENSGSGIVTLIMINGTALLVAADVTNTGGGSIELIAETVTTTIHTDDNTGTNLQNSRVLVRAAAGGPEPHDVIVTITRVTTVSTVAHTAHGMGVGDKFQLKGITDKTEDNGVQTIVTVPGVNSYTYTTTNSGSTNYTGTILSTAVFIDGLTDASGDISDTRVFASNQPIDGFVRKASASPRFKSFGLAGNTIDSVTGLTVNIRMILDEQ